LPVGLDRVAEPLLPNACPVLGLPASRTRAYWDGYNHVDWVNTPLKYNPFPYDCEQDLVYTRTYTSVAGRVTAYASRTMSNC
jgi:hypothetical protein